jgi:hypothetical protein
MPVLRRRPLLRATAIGAGVFYAVKRRQEAGERERAGQAEKFERLAELREQGVLTDEELARHQTNAFGT